jgi:hypothetical protein
MPVARASPHNFSRRSSNSLISAFQPGRGRCIVFCVTKEPHLGATRSIGKVRFSRPKFEVAAKRYERKWRVLDGILYCICNCFPDHQQPGIVRAKLHLIGRSYATGIERKIKNEGSHQGGALEQLAEHFWESRHQVDAIIATLHGVREPLDEQKLEKVLAAHGKLLRITAKTVRTGQTPRSFVSKYLHFHCPAVPIFDSFADRALKRLCLPPRTISVSQRAPVDEIYKQFLGRFWLCYAKARETGAKVSVKHLDRYLVDLLGTKRSKRRSGRLP